MRDLPFMSGQKMLAGAICPSMQRVEITGQAPDDSEGLGVSKRSQVNNIDRRKQN